MSHLCLPQEISDYVLDLLQNEHQTLKQCCLVSKSWAPRAQKHLLAIVEFRSPTAPAKWARTFPDPAYSPGCLARSLHVAYVEDLTNMIASNCDWFRSFSNVVRLRIWIGYPTTPLPRIFELVCLLPLLEDLNISGYDIPYRHQTPPFQPQTSPPLTGTLSLYMPRMMEETISALLDLPNGIRFRRFACTRILRVHLEYMMTLMKACSHTLEYLDIKFGAYYRWKDSINLSGVTKLREVVFRPVPQEVKWVTMGLRTITSAHKDLREVSIITPLLVTPIGWDLMKTPIHNGRTLTVFLFNSGSLIPFARSSYTPRGVNRKRTKGFAGSPRTCCQRRRREARSI